MEEGNFKLSWCVFVLLSVPHVLCARFTCLITNSLRYWCVSPQGGSPALARTRTNVQGQNIKMNMYLFSQLLEVHFSSQIIKERRKIGQACLLFVCIRAVPVQMPPTSSYQMVSRLTYFFSGLFFGELFLLGSGMIVVGPSSEEKNNAQSSGHAELDQNSKW
jgi:hypothetical protein